MAIKIPEYEYQVGAQAGGGGFDAQVSAPTQTATSNAANYIAEGVTSLSRAIYDNWLRSEERTLVEARNDLEKSRTNIAFGKSGYLKTVEAQALTVDSRGVTAQQKANMSLSSERERIAQKYALHEGTRKKFMRETESTLTQFRAQTLQHERAEQLKHFNRTFDAQVDTVTAVVAAQSVKTKGAPSVLAMGFRKLESIANAKQITNGWSKEETDSYRLTQRGRVTQAYILNSLEDAREEIDNRTVNFLKKQLYSVKGEIDAETFTKLDKHLEDLRYFPPDLQKAVATLKAAQQESQARLNNKSKDEVNVVGKDGLTPAQHESAQLEQLKAQLRAGLRLRDQLLFNNIAEETIGSFNASATGKVLHETRAAEAKHIQASQDLLLANAAQHATALFNPKNAGELEKFLDAAHANGVNAASNGGLLTAEDQRNAGRKSAGQVLSAVLDVALAEAQKDPYNETVNQAVHLLDKYKAQIDSDTYSKYVQATERLRNDRVLIREYLDASAAGFNKRMYGDENGQGGDVSMRRDVATEEQPQVFDIENKEYEKTAKRIKEDARLTPRSREQALLELAKEHENNIAKLNAHFKAESEKSQEQYYDSQFKALNAEIATNSEAFLEEPDKLDSKIDDVMKLSKSYATWQQFDPDGEVTQKTIRNSVGAAFTSFVDGALDKALRENKLDYAETLVAALDKYKDNMEAPVYAQLKHRVKEAYTKVKGKTVGADIAKKVTEAKFDKTTKTMEHIAEGMYRTQATVVSTVANLNGVQWDKTHGGLRALALDEGGKFQAVGAGGVHVNLTDLHSDTDFNNRDTRNDSAIQAFIELGFAKGVREVNIDSVKAFYDATPDQRKAFLAYFNAALADKDKNKSISSKQMELRLKKYDADIQATVAATIVGEDKVDKLREEHPKDWLAQLPTDVQKLVQTNAEFWATGDSASKFDGTVVGSKEYWAKRFPGQTDGEIGIALKEVADNEKLDAATAEVARQSARQESNRLTEIRIAEAKENFDSIRRMVVEDGVPLDDIPTSMTDKLNKVERLYLQSIAYNKTDPNGMDLPEAMADYQRKAKDGTLWKMPRDALKYYLYNFSKSMRQKVLTEYNLQLQAHSDQVDAGALEQARDWHKENHRESTERTVSVLRVIKEDRKFDPNPAEIESFSQVLGNAVAQGRLDKNYTDQEAAEFLRRNPIVAGAGAGSIAQQAIHENKFDTGKDDPNDLLSAYASGKWFDNLSDSGVGEGKAILTQALKLLHPNVDPTDRNLRSFAVTLMFDKDAYQTQFKEISQMVNTTPKTVRGIKVRLGKVIARNQHKDLNQLSEADLEQMGSQEYSKLTASELLVLAAQQGAERSTFLAAFKTISNWAF